MKGFREGFGFGLGLALASSGETRPAIRKRRLTNFIYWLSLLLGVGNTILFSNPTQHQFAVLMEWCTGDPTIYPWMFTQLSMAFACLALALAFFCGAVTEDADTSVADLGGLGDVIATLGLAVVAYASVYDMAFYVVWDGIFASSAGIFAVGSTIAYLVRESPALLPDERGTRLFFGNKVKEITKSGVYMTPGAPIPHTIYMLIQYGAEIIPLLWHTYIFPDGRERATQLNVK